MFSLRLRFGLTGGGGLGGALAGGVRPWLAPKPPLILLLLPPADPSAAGATASSADSCRKEYCSAGRKEWEKSGTSRGVRAISTFSVSDPRKSERAGL